jgi:hypothetical protein
MGGTAGALPVAITTALPSSARVPPPWSATSTRRGESSFPLPNSTSTPRDSNRSAESCGAMVSIAACTRPATLGQVKAGSGALPPRPPARIAATVAALLIRALEGTQP